MDNPIPSVMVYLDDREHRGVICVDDNSDRRREVEACTNSGELGLHTHAWKPLGWMSDAVFMTVRPRGHGAVTEFIRAALFSVIEIRNDFDRMKHEHEVTLRANENLRASIRELVGGLDGTICHIKSEEKRLEVARLVGKHASRILSTNEPNEEAS